MERLTYRDANGELWYSDNGTERDRLHRLAAYEDTGFTPEEVQQMRWIPVEERLPKPQENPVIACDYTGVCLAWYSPTMGWQYRTGLSGVDITHWMPLPQPPRRKAMNKICSECPYKDKCEYTTLTPDLRGESCQYYSLAERSCKHE